MHQKGGFISAGKILKISIGKLLPKNMSVEIITIVEMMDEHEHLRERLFHPLKGHFIRFCTSNFSFKDIETLLFCIEIVKSIVAVVAGGTGIATLAMMIITNPDKVFDVLTKALIPALKEEKKKGRDSFHRTLNRIFTILVGISLEKLEKMDVTEFIDYVQNRKGKIKFVGDKLEEKRVQERDTDRLFKKKLQENFRYLEKDKLLFKKTPYYKDEYWFEKDRRKREKKLKYEQLFPSNSHFHKHFFHAKATPDKKDPTYNVIYPK